VTPTWNRARYLPECIESVLAQEFPGLEHVIVDDGSTDDTPAVLRRYGDRVRSVRQENAGQSAAWNRCLELARGEFVAFLDSDDAWLPGKLARQIPMLDRDPGAGLLYAAVEYMDEDGKPSPVRGSRRGTPSGWILPRLLETNVMNTGTVVVRRELLRKAGPFDGAYVSVNDWDMWLRVCATTRVIYDPVVSCRMRRHAGQIIADREKMDAARVRLLEDNLRRIERTAPEHAAAARRGLARLYLRRVRRALRDGRRAEAETEIARALELDPGARLRAAFLRLGDGLRRALGPRAGTA
jgi:glycosyltransferase involved in cell wall biosynthesis